MRDFFRWRTARWDASGPAQASGSGWRAGLQQLAAELDRLNRSTEDEFVAVGERLGGFMSVARRISEDIKGLMDLIADQDGQSSAQALIRALEGSRELLKQSEEAGGTLGSLGDSARAVRKELASFEAVISSFGSVGIMTRIEAARLAGSGLEFGHVAEAVQRLTGDIGTGVERTLTAVSGFESDVCTALAGIVALEARNRDELPELIGGLTRDIERFQHALQCARSASELLAGRYDEVTATIRNLAVSIQFHDITRQQVEHIVQALTELSSNPEGAADVPPGAVTAALSLQAAQLAGTAHTFGSAVGKMDQGLAAIAAQILGMAADSATLMGSSAGDQDSFFLDMERRFSTVLSGLVHCCDVQEEARKALERLRQLVGHVRRPVRDIQGIQIEIERLAINAAIRATHLGAAGDTLNVLAGAMQDRASDCRTLSDRTGERLDSMNEVLRQAIGSGVLTARDGLLEELPARIRALHGASERSLSRISEIAGLAENLAGTVREVRAGFTIGGVFSEVSTRCLEKLAQLAPATDTSGAPQTDNLDRFAARYTMQAERDV
ncbi:MAG: hypothetical protein NTY38_00740, partial [Acidobacteria bacterium]|nr:hypothetical protein [Acidobacteriota bacterium]